ncbi:hypothetical protein Tco_0812670 [Tanacetum coccineum]
MKKPHDEVKKYFKGYASGTNIAKFPAGGYVHSFPFYDSSESGATHSFLASGTDNADSAILGLVEVGGSRIAVEFDCDNMRRRNVFRICVRVSVMFPQNIKNMAEEFQGR